MFGGGFFWEGNGVGHGNEKEIQCNSAGFSFSNLVSDEFVFLCLGTILLI